jgi:threonine dehydratase
MTQPDVDPIRSVSDDPTTTQGVSLAGVHRARGRIEGSVRVTPLLHKPTLSQYAGGQPVYLKCEHLQRTGSFKLRGALNLVAQLTPEERARGVVAASAGNHAQGVAVAAAEHGVSATIFMPEDASLAKVEATRNYGAEVRLAGDSLTATLVEARAFADARNAVFVHPFDDDRIIEGQGTLGLELVEQLPEVGTVVLPIGGGGLAAGVATVVRELRPDCRIIGVQAAACPSFAASLAAGHPVHVDARPTMADGIAVKQPGARTFALLRDLVDEHVEVEETEIAAAILWSMERAKQVVEGAGAVPLAALLAGRITGPGPVAIMMCGGNVDPANLMTVIRHGLSAVGRYLRLTTSLADRPGELSRLLQLMASLRVNILGIEHHREGMGVGVGETRVDLVLQTRNAEHVVEVEQAMVASGYPVLSSSL